ncbi:MAG TPA: membrane protein insertion efficiency factor YidD [Terriglobales bacterium]|nr:membrane protein insertion efficiency factor YidD [Terriglobales bacterium]
MAVARNAVLLLLRGYKAVVSPLLPPSCRFVPTCSEYATEAVERYGVLRGSWMAVTRLLRCHPFAKGGYDPVVRAGEIHVASGGQGSTHVSP